MGVDTHGFIKTDYNGLYRFIKEYIDPKAKKQKINYEGYNQILYNFANEQRTMHCHNLRFGGVYIEKDEEWYYNEYETYGESQSYSLNQQGIPDKTPGIFISMRMRYFSIEIVKTLGLHFGGWVDDSDCDDEYYYQVKPEHAYDVIELIFKKEPEG